MIRKLTLLLAALGLALWCRAQDVRTVNGEKYIVHTVEQGQTLFGISKHYAVPLQAIMEANPGADQGLSIGQVLLIPRKEQDRKELKRAPKLSDGELLHTVARKETVYGISRQYGVSPDDLRRWNPDLTYGLRPGMQLRIQVARSTAAPPVAVKPAVMDSDEFHQVAPQETLYALSKRYGRTVDEIKAANGGLPEGLKAGMYIRIPHAEAVAKADTATVDTLVPHPSLSVVRKIGVMLPFTALASDTSSTSDENGSGTSATQAAIEFRAGLGLALDTLRGSGLNAEVYVFDTGMEPAQWNPLFKSDAVRGMDLYIGPFHRTAVEALARVVGGAPIVCPVPQSNKVLLGNPTVSKAVSSRNDRMQLMARYIAFHHANDNVLLLRPDIFSERDLAAQMVRQVQEAMIARAGASRDSVPVILCGRRDVSAAVARLSATRRNVLVVPSEDVEFVTKVLSKFGELVPKQDIVVYGLNAWTGMKSLDISALMKLDVHVPASGFIDRSSPAVAAFTAKYRERFHNEPGEYAFMGYDVALYFIGAEMQFGDGFAQHYAQVQADPLFLGFRMEKLGPENGWSNANAVMLEYRPEGIRKAE
jgi:LysM repeat protein